MDWGNKRSAESKYEQAAVYDPLPVGLHQAKVTSSEFMEGTKKKPECALCKIEGEVISGAAKGQRFEVMAFAANEADDKGIERIGDMLYRLGYTTLLLADAADVFKDTEARPNGRIIEVKAGEVKEGKQFVNLVRLVAERLYEAPAEQRTPFDNESYEPKAPPDDFPF